MTSEKWWSRQLQGYIYPCPWRSIKNQAETVRTNYVRILENSQKFKATEQTRTQEKGNLQMIRKFCGVLLALVPSPPLHATGGLARQAVTTCNPNVGPWSLGLEETEQTFPQNYCVCLF